MIQKTIFKLDSKLTFGKYKGQTIQEIIDSDNSSYLEWACDSIDWFELDAAAEDAVDADLYYDDEDYSWHEAYDLLA